MYLLPHVIEGLFQVVVIVIAFVGLVWLLNAAIDWMGQ